MNDTATDTMESAQQLDGHHGLSPDTVCRRNDGKQLLVEISGGPQEPRGNPAWDDDPSVNYPMNVAVGFAGKLTLYALGLELTVRDLFQSPLVDILDLAIARLSKPRKSEKGITYPGPARDRRRDEAVDALTELKKAIAELSRGGPKGKKAKKDSSAVTLEYLCSTPPDQWSPDREKVFRTKAIATTAQAFFAVPFVRIDSEQAAEFLGADYNGKGFFELLGDATVADMFTRPKADFDAELGTLIPQARRIGLLWCSPVGYWRRRAAESAYATARRNARELGRNSAVRSVLLRSPGRVATVDGTKSTPSYSDDYCQIVGGVYNVLSDQRQL